LGGEAGERYALIPSGEGLNRIEPPIRKVIV